MWKWWRDGSRAVVVDRGLIIPIDLPMSKGNNTREYCRTLEGFYHNRRGHAEGEGLAASEVSHSEEHRNICLQEAQLSYPAPVHKYREEEHHNPAEDNLAHQGGNIHEEVQKVQEPSSYSHHNLWYEEGRQGSLDSPVEETQVSYSHG